MGTILFVSFFFAVGLAFILMGVKSVDQGWEYTVERFGKYSRTLKPGFNLIFPTIDHIRYKVDMRERVLDLPAQEVITEDNAIVSVNGVVFFQIFNAAQAMYEVESYQSAILNLVATNIRGAMGSLKLDEILSKRDEISKELLHDVDNATQPWGVKILRVKIKDIDPPEDLKIAMAKEMTAEREKRAAILKAEGEKTAAIRKAEGEKDAAILAAEAESEAQLLEADWRREAAFREAEGRERQAEAEARATELVSAAIKAGDVNAINYFVAQKYVEALQSIASAENQKLLMMPLEASSLIGSIGGIGEISKQLFNNQPANDSSTLLPNSGSSPTPSQNNQNGQPGNQGDSQ